MRQLLAATVLVAVLGLPTAWYVGAFDAAPPATVPAAKEMSRDAAEAIIEHMHEIAAAMQDAVDTTGGAADSLSVSADGPTSAASGVGISLHASAPNDRGTLTGLAGKIGGGTPGKPENDASVAEAAKVDDAVPDVPPAEAVVRALPAVPAVATIFSGRYPRFATVGFAAGQGGLVSRDYPTSFYWFYLV